MLSLSDRESDENDEDIPDAFGPEHELDEDDMDAFNSDPERCEIEGRV